MSLGKCQCPCQDWKHGGVCDGTVGASLPKAPYLEGWAHRPCCRPCYVAILGDTSRRAIQPRAPNPAG